MCERIIQEYKIWLEEVLDVLHTICEDVVPAGRLSEELYWQTKALYRAYERENAEAFQVALFQYTEEGRALLTSVKAEIEALLNETAQFGENNEAEEVRIRIRREHAGEIFSSLQMLVNCAGFIGRCAELSHLFEIDTRDNVKRIHSGVVVAEDTHEIPAKLQASTSVWRQKKAYPFVVEQNGNWKRSIAG